MAFAFDFDVRKTTLSSSAAHQNTECSEDDDGVTAWRATGDSGGPSESAPHGARAERDEEYQPTMFVHAADRRLDALADRLADDPKVAELRWTERYLDLHADERSEVLAVDVARVREVQQVACEIRERHEAEFAPGALRLYNVDFSPGFRYCVETGTDPTPARDLRTLAVRTTDRALAHDDVTSLRIDSERVAGSEDAVLRSLATRIRRVDPDVLVVSHGDLLPLVAERAAAHGVDFRWGRESQWTDNGVTQLAAANAYESYGRVGHSPARYTVPGRAVLDESNSFLWGHSGLAGLRYLVEQSWKPIEEAGWASIGNVLTAMQTREALERDVLVPWNKWEPEQFKEARTLHAADRGGTTLAPEVGRHEDVYEVDFASLYPSIIREYNVSPDTVLCDCHPDREDVPELGYNVCPEDGFLGDVLGPLLDDRKEFKDDLSDATGEEADRLEAKSAAIKWVLVSCFGYQGYRNSKFGRIEAHEAINAYARDILLTAKARFEERGWHVAHAIVDSLWVTPGDDPAPLADVCDELTAELDVRLEREATYDWVCFVPRRGERAGALTTYFGKVADADEFKLRGVEARQRSTPTFVEECQRELLRVLDRTGDPEAVVDRLRRDVNELRGGNVDPADLVVTKRASKPPGEYDRETRTVAALRRYEAHGIDRNPGQSVQYVVTDDRAADRREAADRASGYGGPASRADGRRRVCLPFEAGASDYDADYYADRLVRAARTVVAPFGWTRDCVERELRTTRDLDLASF